MLSLRNCMGSLSQKCWMKSKLPGSCVIRTSCLTLTPLSTLPISSWSITSKATFTVSSWLRKDWAKLKYSESRKECCLPWSTAIKKVSLTETWSPIISLLARRASLSCVILGLLRSVRNTSFPSLLPIENLSICTFPQRWRIQGKLTGSKWTCSRWVASSTKW